MVGVGSNCTVIVLGTFSQPIKEAIVSPKQSHSAIRHNTDPASHATTKSRIKAGKKFYHYVVNVCGKGFERVELSQ